MTRSHHYTRRLSSLTMHLLPEIPPMVFHIHLKQVVLCHQEARKDCICPLEYLCPFHAHRWPELQDSEVNSRKVYLNTVLILFNEYTKLSIKMILIM